MDENAGGTLYKRNKKNKAAWAGADIRPGYIASQKICHALQWLTRPENN